MSELADHSLAHLADALEARTVSSVEATDACLKRIEATTSLNAFLQVSDHARADAEAADRRRAAEEHRGPLDGVPVAVKDILLTADMPTTCASHILEGYRAPYEASVVTRLREAGAVLLGKTNLDEFAMGGSSEHSAFGPVRNPWDPSRVPGGSSGGSAVAVASGAAFGALGTDTGGSVRQPAGLCGITGLKPTYGRVPRWGMVAFASSLDQVGPMGKEVRDVSLLLQAIAGFDPRDATSAEEAVPDFGQALETGARGLRIGVPKEYFGDGLQDDVRTAMDEALKVYQGLGATLVDISLPHSAYGVATYYLIATAEASSNLARFDGVRYGLRRGAEGGLRQMYSETRREGFGTEVKRRILLGTYALSAGYYDAYYLKAQKVRTLIRQDFTEAFDTVDVVAVPTSPTTAFALGEKTDDPVTMYLADVFTITANLAGIPGISIPAGFDSAGLPIGLQLLGQPFDEAPLLQAARAFERETSWHQARAPR